MARKLYRIPEQGQLAGVAAGFADYLEIDVTLMRLMFVAAMIFTGGAALIAYIVLAIVLPTSKTPSNKPIDISDRVEDLADEIKTSGRAKNAGNYIGLGLVILGVWLLIGQIFPGWFELQWSILWPVLVIVLGVWIIAKGRKQ